MTDEAMPHRYPVWASLLRVMGWLIIGATAIAVLLLLIGTFFGTRQVHGHGARIAMVFAGGAIGATGLVIGSALQVVARSARRDPPFSRLVLWARLIILFGLEFCLSIPLALYGSWLLKISRVRDLIGNPISLLDLDLLLLVARVAAIPVAVGLAMIATALIWGRRKPPVDIPAIFS